MKIGIFTNFAQPYHTGGAERVVQQIAETMVNEFGDECFIFCQYGKTKINHNKVEIVPIGNITDEFFIKILSSYKIDHHFIYSDWYFKFYALLKYIPKLSGTFSLIPVGFNRCRSNLPHNKVLSNLFISNKNKFSVAVHSGNYFDAEFCKQQNIKYQIIPNGVDLTEFGSANSTVFREKYKIDNKKILLSVGNFFPGKGQENLLQIVKQLKSMRNDFVLCSISSRLEFAIGDKLHEDFISKAKNLDLPIIDLQNIPRHEVVEAFSAADIFLSASQQEVSPLVILEAMAAKTPWISMNVGNVEELDGGIFIEAVSNADGTKVFDAKILAKYIDSINLLLDRDDYHSNLTEQGYQQILDVYNWEKIKYQYKELFHAKNISCNASL